MWLSRRGIYIGAAFVFSVVVMWYNDEVTTKNFRYSFSLTYLELFFTMLPHATQRSSVVLFFPNTYKVDSKKALASAVISSDTVTPKKLLRLLHTAWTIASMSRRPFRTSRCLISDVNTPRTPPDHCNN